MAEKIKSKVKFKVKTAGYNQGLLNEKYVPIHSYFLYLFWKKGDEHKLFLQTDDQNKKLKVAGKYIPVVGKPDTTNPELCDYAFVRKETYYGCFSGKELDVDELETIATTTPERLIHLYPAGPTVKIDHSLFWWLCLLENFEESPENKTKNILEILSLLKNIFFDDQENPVAIASANANTEPSVNSSLLINKILALPDKSRVDLGQVILAVEKKINGDKPDWENRLQLTANSTVALLNNPATENFAGCSALESKWEAKQKIQLPHQTLMSDTYGMCMANDNESLFTHTTKKLSAFIYEYFKNPERNPEGAENFESLNRIAQTDTTIFNPESYATMVNELADSWDQPDAGHDAMAIKSKLVNYSAQYLNHEMSVLNTPPVHSIDDFPNAHISLLSDFRVDLSNFDTWDLTRLYEALSIFELAKASHEAGTTAEIFMFGYKISINYLKSNTKETGEYAISDDDKEFRIKTVLDSEKSEAQHQISYKDKISGLSFKQSYSHPLIPRSSLTINTNTTIEIQEGEPYTNKYMELIPVDDMLLAIVGLDDIANRRSPDSRIMSKEVLDKKIERCHIPFLDCDTALAMGVLGSNIHIPRFERILNLPGQFSGVTGATTWQGNLSELSFITRRPFTQINLNSIRNNHPIWDAKGRLFTNKLTSLKSSIQAKQAGRYGYYTQGLEDIAGGMGVVKTKWTKAHNGTKVFSKSDRYVLFNTTAQNIYPNLSPTEARRLAQLSGQLAINSGDVIGYRANIENRIKRPNSHAIYMRDYLNVLLSDKPIDISLNNQSILKLRSIPDIEAAATSGTITGDQRTQAYDTLAKRVSSRIVSSGVTMQQLIDFKNARGTSREPLRNAINPEGLHKISSGSTLRASIQTAKRGGVTGIVSQILYGGYKLYNKEDPNYKEDLIQIVVTTVLAGASGAIGAATETTAANIALSRLGNSTGTGTLSPFFARVVGVSSSMIGGGVAGGITAPIVELGVMAYEDFYMEDIDHSAVDYTARGSRAAVGGIISGSLGAGAYALSAAGSASLATWVLASAGAGAAGASIVPVVGTAVGLVAGLVVGAAAYYLYDTFGLGATVEGTVRDIFDSDQPKQLSQTHRLVGNWDLSRFGYFSIVHRRLKASDNFLVKATGAYVSHIFPSEDDETVLLEVVPANTVTVELFGVNNKSLYVPAEMLKKY